MCSSVSVHVYLKYVKEYNWGEYVRESVCGVEECGLLCKVRGRELRRVCEEGRRVRIRTLLLIYPSVLQNIFKSRLKSFGSRRRTGSSLFPNEGPRSSCRTNYLIQNSTTNGRISMSLCGVSQILIFREDL